MTVSLTDAKRTWGSAIHWDADQADPFPSVQALREALDVILASRPNDPRAVDSLDLASSVLGEASGANLLSALLWNTGLGQIQVERALPMVRMLLRKSADPNLFENGYRPLDMLFAGIHNSILTESVDFVPLFEVLVDHGMDHKVPGKYSIEEIQQQLSKDGVDDRVIHILVEGCAAVELSSQTPQVARASVRRAL